SREGAPASVPEPLGCLARQRPDWLTDVAKLLAVSPSLLEVVPDDLRILGRAVSGRALEPARDALMHLSTRLLGNGLVGRVAEQDGAEPVAAPAEARALRSDQPALQERV